MCHIYVQFLFFLILFLIIKIAINISEILKSHFHKYHPQHYYKSSFHHHNQRHHYLGGHFVNGCFRRWTPIGLFEDCLHAKPLSQDISAASHQTLNISFNPHPLLQAFAFPIYTVLGNSKRKLFLPVSYSVLLQCTLLNVIPKYSF